MNAEVLPVTGDTVTDRIPDLTLPAFDPGHATTNQTDIAIRDHARTQGANYLVLYFYPKDSTPGCTTEAQGFRDHYAAFRAAGAVILGVSRDTLRAHGNFCSKQNLPFPLLSDTDETLCLALDVMRQKMMYGKQVRGIERSTFLVDATGQILQQWRGVKVPGHVEQVLAAIQAL